LRNSPKCGPSSSTYATTTAEPAIWWFYSATTSLRPIYSLSAAEAFTYILQDFDRAVVVGERTAGMANPSRTFTIAGRFDLTVPFLLIRYGESGGTFAGVGVTPDIEVSAESALETALERLGRGE
jgi:C-terminal processing protease CtpA/Prc